MKHLLNEIDYDSNADYDISNYLIKSNEFLIEKLKHGLPISFIINANNTCLFLIKNQEAQHFSFSNYMQMQMGLNYFKISHMKNTHAPLYLTKHGIIVKCILLVMKVTQSDCYSYTVISNNWLTLNKYSSFRVMDDFNYNN